MKKLLIFLALILICFSVNSQDKKQISRTWISFSQSKDVASDTIKKFKVIAWVKVDTKDDEAWAGIWARVDNKPDEGRGFFDNMRDRPIKSNTWESYVVEGVIDSKSKTLNFGAICLNNGKFFFDKFELYIEDSNGNYQAVPISNANFEEQIKDNVIPKWNQGISKGEQYRVKEFTFKTSKDKVEGSYSVLVEGKGISKNTGSAEAVYPNIGIFILLLYALVLVFALMTYRSSNIENQWSKIGRIGFRFSFIYFLLIIIFENNGAYPFFELLAEKPVELSQNFITWFGESVLKVPYKISTGPNGSGDTTYDYLVVFIVFIVALIGTLIWTLLDRKRTNYDKLYYWLTTAIRYYVGLMLISYGLVKVIQLQFPEPNFYRLLEPYGDSSPMGLAWTFLGFSEGYNMFMGIAEVLAGLLLFRRTLTLGAVITLMTTMNVMAVNYFFDVPVKILSTHLVIMTLFLLWRDIKKVILFLLTNKAVTNVVPIKRPSLKKGFNISLNIIKVLILSYALGYGFYNAKQSQKSYGSKASKPKLYGVYEVTNYVINGDTITNYKSDKLWKNIRFERVGRVQIEKMNKENLYYKVEEDSITNKITFSPSGNTSEAFDFNYTTTEKTLEFSFIHKNDTISGQTKRLGKEDFLLTNRGFHWISEYPYNR
ncbi:hypothetical protein [Algibacter aquimarinus]|uniref:DoxX family protein n=1 Tax=Algibacter aquimarinus TaxID=1136748 RepID=A0ABP9H6L7_9FLAO